MPGRHRRIFSMADEARAEPASPSTSEQGPGAAAAAAAQVPERDYVRFDAELFRRYLKRVEGLDGSAREAMMTAWAHAPEEQRVLTVQLMEKGKQKLQRLRELMEAEGFQEATRGFVSLERRTFMETKRKSRNRDSYEQRAEQLGDGATDAELEDEPKEVRVRVKRRRQQRESPSEEITAGGSGGLGMSATAAGEGGAAPALDTSEIAVGRAFELPAQAETEGEQVQVAQEEPLLVTAAIAPTPQFLQAEADEEGTAQDLSASPAFGL